jgi:hypothetical protein
MARETKDMLWYWIIGMSDLIIHSKSGTYDYDDDISSCNDEVQRLNPHVYTNQEEFMAHQEE